MEDIMRYELFAVLLGSTRGARAVARRLRAYGVRDAVLVSEARPLLPSPLCRMPRYAIPHAAADELLLAALYDVEIVSGTALPLLVVCDARYAGFVSRCREELERRFVVRDAQALLEASR